MGLKHIWCNGSVGRGVTAGEHGGGCTEDLEAFLEYLKEARSS